MNRNINPPNQLTDADDGQYPDLSLKDKLNRHFDNKRRIGILSNATKLDKCVPWFFLFVYLGASAWLVLLAVPYHYKHSPWRLFMVEALTIYAFVQVFINWLLTSYTVSPYLPDTERTIQGKEMSSATTSHINGILASYENSAEEHVNEKDQGHTALTYKVMVAANFSGKNLERLSVPYWSWVQCLRCHRLRPPRCHHCTLCNHCVLKRDHHCYFARNCIGVNNQRYFIYYLIWCVILCSIACVQLIPFIFQDILPKYSYLDLVFPINFYRCIMGELPLMYNHLIIVTWGVVFLTFVSYGTCGNSIYLMLKGLTNFESTAGIKINDTRSRSAKLRSVMGRNWGVGFFIPGAAAFPFIAYWLPPSLAPSDPTENPVDWPFIKL